MSDWASERVQKWREALWAEKGLLAAAAASDFDVASLLRSIRAEALKECEDGCHPSIRESARAEAIEEAAEKLLYQHRGAAECAATYGPYDLGQPRQMLLREAHGWSKAAEMVRALLDQEVSR